MAQQALEDSTKLFEAEQYLEARALAEAALNAQGVDADVARSLKLLIRKCKTHIDPQQTNGNTATVTQPSESGAQSTPAAAPSSDTAPKPRPTLRHEWFQTPQTVTFSIYAKNRTESQVTVHAEPRSIEIVIKLDDGSEFQITHDPLYAEVDPSRTAVSVRQPKVEVVLYKKNPGIHWAVIELTGEAAKSITSGAPPVVALPATQSQLAYPNSKGKDWSKFKTEFDDKDKPGHVTGDEGLNKLFQDIYRNANDDCRRAMVKSFTESGGTVLSTNWTDIGSRKCEGEAPKGMEMRKWEH